METHCQGFVELQFVNVSSSAVDIYFTTYEEGGRGNFTIVYAAAGEDTWPVEEIIDITRKLVIGAFTQDKTQTGLI